MLSTTRIYLKKILFFIFWSSGQILFYCHLSKYLIASCAFAQQVYFSQWGKTDQRTFPTYTDIYVYKLCLNIVFFVLIENIFCAINFFSVTCSIVCHCEYTTFPMINFIYWIRVSCRLTVRCFIATLLINLEFNVFFPNFRNVFINVQKYEHFNLW